MDSPLGVPVNRWRYRPAPISFRPLTSGLLHKPACRRPNPDRPLGPKVERIRRALDAAMYLAMVRNDAPIERRIPVAARLVVDEWIDSITRNAPTGRKSPQATPEYEPDGQGGSDT